jgi:hypothetical protein
MRTRLLAVGALSLGLGGLPAFALAGPRDEGHDRPTQVRHEQPRQETLRHNDYVNVRHETTVAHDRPIIHEEHRDVRIDEHVRVDHPRHWDEGRHCWVDDVVIAPPAVVVDTPVLVAPATTDTPLAITQVPPVVLDAAARLTANAPIVGVDFIHVPGGTFYDVHVTAAYNAVRTLRFGINGGYWGDV